MTATLEQTQADLLKLLGMVQQGEEVVITSQGRPVAKLTGVPQANPAPNRQAWLDRPHHRTDSRRRPRQLRA